MEDLTTRFLDVLNFPLLHRCPELGLLIDRCSTKQLQDLFPILIKSIFGLNGGTGWGFRTITRNFNPHEFEILYNFFIPLGPMFRLCYRLLNDALRFELPIALIPTKMRHMLESGRYPLFYSDIVNIEPFERKITSLALNAFDFYMLNFAIHGTIPIHKEYSAALTIQNDKLKSVYFFLTADYLCSFLPSDPEAVVLPQNICGSVKTSLILPVQPVQSKMRSPKYLSLSAISHFSPTNNPSTRAPDLPRSHAWRTESVLYIFIDTWLRFECDSVGDLPNNEFIRVVRVLVKQIHAFGNSSELDNTSVSTLREIAQPMLNSRMYPFLRAIISRWPLDSSFSVVLELWLSFIQPWRYTYTRNISIGQIDIPINNAYENFILENIITYTQIFIQLLPRFLSLDLTSFRNSIMIYRLLKVFGQTSLADILRNYEYSLNLNYGNNITNFHHASPNRGDSGIRNINVSNPSRSFDSLTLRQETFLQDDSYVMMFGEQVLDQVSDIIRKLQLSRAIAREQINAIEKEIHEKYRGFFGLIKWFFKEPETNINGITLNDRKKIPEILQLCIQTLGIMFRIEISESPLLTPDECNTNENTITDMFNFETSRELDISNPYELSPSIMKKRALTINYSGDPELIPIQNSECTFLVRFLHQVASKLNIMYSSEINQLWYNNNLCGKIARVIFSPPIIARTFDKSSGYSVLKEDHIGPRISLRFLAGYRTLLIILFSLIIGQFFFSAPSFGFFILLIITFIYVFVLSLVNNVPI